MKLITSLLARKREKALNRKMYWISNIAWWIYTIIWLFILFKIWYDWDVAVWYKLGVNFIMILGTPALSDLVKPYNKYLKEWEANYGGKGVSP